jgi:hypothetical protein
MLFICNDDGVPSVAEWIHLGPAARTPTRSPEHVERKHWSHLEFHRPGFPIPGFEPPKPKRPRSKKKSPT